jgi:hypothetical protein
MPSVDVIFELNGNYAPTKYIGLYDSHNKTGHAQEEVFDEALKKIARSLSTSCKKSRNQKKNRNARNFEFLSRRFWNAASNSQSG